MESMEKILTDSGYKARYPSFQHLLEYGQDRFERVVNILSGRPWEAPWKNRQNPIMIKGVA